MENNAATTTAGQQQQHQVLPVPQATAPSHQQSGGDVNDVSLDTLKEALNPALTTEEQHARSHLRKYTEETANRVRDNYRSARTHQTVDHVLKLREKYEQLSIPMGVWEATALLDNFVDLSDPDVDLPNLVHLYQTAEGIREAGLPDWLQLTGFLHDLGKLMYIRGNDAEGTSVKEQWSVVGDTFIVGCELPKTLVFPEFSELNGDQKDEVKNSKYGIYEPHCGLDNCLLSYGHDEYLYQVLTQNPGVKLPPEALYIIRYHSCYPWHDKREYTHLESDYDKDMLQWVKLFNRHDLYTKKNIVYSEEQMAEMRAYYDALIDKYLPEKLLW